MSLATSKKYGSTIFMYRGKWRARIVLEKTSSGSIKTKNGTFETRDLAQKWVDDFVAKKSPAIATSKCMNGYDPCDIENVFCKCGAACATCGWNIDVYNKRIRQIHIDGLTKCNDGMMRLVVESPKVEVAKPVKRDLLSMIESGEFGEEILLDDLYKLMLEM